MAMGLIQSTSADAETIEQQVTPQVPEASTGNEYLDSLNAVHESLVLLKNTNNYVPVRNIKSTIENVILVGESIYNLNGLTKTQLYRNFDNIGMQCGGWSVRWQGYQGNEFWSGVNKASSNATSVLDALLALQKSAKVHSLIN
jgi:beta-glucosidase